MIVSPHYIRIFWRRIVNHISPRKRLFYTSLVCHSGDALLAVLCTPFETSILLAIWCQSCSWIYHRRGKSALSAVEFLVERALTALFHCLAITAIFCRGVGSGVFAGIYPFSSHFFLVFVCCTWRINQRSEWLDRQWHSPGDRR